MGKSGGRKKKSGSINQSQSQSQEPGRDSNKSSVLDDGGNLYLSVFAKRAHELKEDGNKRFQEKDFVGALQQYENALKLTPKLHPDRAVFHSNRAACLMQMKPIDYNTVISECTLALEVQPQYVRALLRRARAFEAIGKYEMAMQDAQLLLIMDPNHSDALEISGRLRTVLGPRQAALVDLQSRPSPAALGASAVGAPIAGLGPCLPARPLSKKPVSSNLGQSVASSKSEKLYPVPTLKNDIETKIPFPKVVLMPSSGSSKPNTSSIEENLKEKPAKAEIRLRALKLVYDQDIRLAQMPVSCSFKVLREVISTRLPMSKSVLIKCKDSDGDLVTLTCTSELRMAEASVDNLIPKDPDSDIGDSIGMLRLHIVEVSPEQEPPILEEEEEKPVDNNSPVETVDVEIDNTEKVSQKGKNGIPEESEVKEVEMDDWLFEFAQLFRSHVGIDPDSHIDLHEIGMELSSEALEETVTSENAQILFDKAAMKFQEVAALAFFNWGNVHMCAARKKIPIDDSASKEKMNAQIQIAYDWVKEKYQLARGKYEEALAIKPDFYEGLLALGQQQFEMAKLHWSFVLAKKEDLSKWDPSETISLFDSAEEKMKVATEIWEKVEEQRAIELKDASTGEKDELLKRRGQSAMSPEEVAEQTTAMKAQIHLFWGNMLFERSQLECKLGFDGWKKNLDLAVERFKLAGATEVDISTVVKNHCSNEEAKDLHEEKSDNLNTDVV